MLMNRFIRIYTCVCLTISVSVLYHIELNANYIWIAPVIINIFLAYEFRSNKVYFILFLFFLSYSITPYFYFFRGLDFSIWYLYQNDPSVNKVAVLNAIFLTCLYIGLSEVNDKNLISSTDLLRRNFYIFYLSFTICIILFLLGLSGSTLLDGVISHGSTEKSPLYGYFIIPFLCCLISADDKQKRLLITLLIFYSIKGFLYGARIEVLSSWMMFLVFHTDFFRKISYKKIFILLIFAVLILKFVERFRTFPLEILSFLMDFDLKSLFNVLFVDNDLGRLSNNQGDVYNSSLRLLWMEDKGFYDLEFVVLGFLSFLFNLPLSFSSEFRYYSDLGSYKKDLYGAGGGLLFLIIFISG